MVTYIVLLGAALFHGLYGLRNILFEAEPRARAEEDAERRADRRGRRAVRFRRLGGVDELRVGTRTLARLIQIDTAAARRLPAAAL